MAPKIQNGVNEREIYTRNGNFKNGGNLVEYGGKIQILLVFLSRMYLLDDNFLHFGFECNFWTLLERHPSSSAYYPLHFHVQNLRF